MAVFRWGSPLEAFRDMEREMDRVLRTVNQAFEGLRVGRPYPPVNVYELPSEYLLTAELPGVRTEDLELSVVNGQLVLRGQRVEPNDPPPERYRRNERPHGQWERSIPLPERVQEEQMSAEFINGVLTVHLPKTPSAQPRQIPISETNS
ncbi:Hsp20/alpha crystallin family protein [Caulifigura coniformis]|nr:Hsp20/alpha crystallin family protein [Caulifigura coniformis]